MYAVEVSLHGAVVVRSQQSLEEVRVGIGVFLHLRVRKSYRIHVPRAIHLRRQRRGHEAEIGLGSELDVAQLEEQAV